MTDTRHAPWWIVPSDNKKAARVNCISHILSSIPYEHVAFDEPKLGKRQKRPDDFVEHPAPRNIVPDVLARHAAERVRHDDQQATVD
jgi:polyphosphate kinase